MRSSSFAFSLVALVLSGDKTSAFTVGGGPRHHEVSLFAHDTSSLTCDRSAFIKTSLASIAAITTLSPTIAFADNDDLSMPTAEEQKAADVSCTQYG